MLSSKMKISGYDFHCLLWIEFILLSVSGFLVRGFDGPQITTLSLADTHLANGPLVDRFQHEERSNADQSLTKQQKRKLRKERKEERKKERRENRRQRKRITDAGSDESFSNEVAPKINAGDISAPRIFSSNETPKPMKAYFPDMTWLASNLTSIWQLLQQMQKDIKQIRRVNRSHAQSASKKAVPTNASQSKVDHETTTEKCNPDWPFDPKACLQNSDALQECSGKGDCVCGQCVCESPYYGIHCQCNDHICQSFGGVMCGGAGRGQCRCGSCVCRPGFTGDNCDCSSNTATCETATGVLCSGHGNCVCGRCQCEDGYSGDVCQDSIYSATVCERLKPCVLCRAFGRNYPQCEDCNIVVELVEELELSQTTCVMINFGCIVKYAYSKSLSSAELTTVFVPKAMTCPPPGTN